MVDKEPIGLVWPSLTNLLQAGSSDGTIVVPSFIKYHTGNERNSVINIRFTRTDTDP